MVKVTENGMGITGIFYAATRAIKGGVEAVVELDTALVELNKVTDVSSSQLNSFVSSARDAGDAVARTTSEMVDATAQFAKMGFSLSESLDLASQAAILVNISDGIDDITTASSNLISVLKGFNLEASESSRILDVINEVSNTYAVSSSDLTGAMAKVSATLAAQNNTLEESVALVTAGNEILQDFSRTATGIRTISLRLTGVDENGEEIDGLTSSLQQYFDEYETGVQLMNSATGEWNSTYSILSQLSKTWETLTAEEQSHLTYLVSGIRQSDIMNSILTNQETLTNSLTTALNSEGSALKENAIYMDSIQAKITLFSKEVQDMWQNTISSDTIKFFVDLGTVIIKVIDEIGLLTSALFILGTYFLVSGKLSKAIPLIKLITAGFAKLSWAITGTTGAVTALSTAMTLGLVLAVAAVVAITRKLSKELEILREEAQKTALELDNVTSEYLTLLDKSLIKSEELTLEEEKRLGVLREQMEVTRELLDLQGEEISRKELYGTFWDKAKSALFGTDFMQVDGKFTAGLIGDLKKELDTIEGSTSNSAVVEAKKNALDLVNTIKLAYEQLGETVPTEVQIMFDKITTIVEETQSSIDSALSGTDRILESVFSAERSGAVFNFESAIGDLALKLGLTREEAKTFYSSWKDINHVIEDTIDPIDELTTAQEDTIDPIDELTTAQEDFNTVLDNTISNLESLESIYSSIQEGEKLSLSTLYDLQQQYPNLTNLIWHANDSKEAGLKLTEAINKAEKQTLLDSNALAKGEIENNLKIAKIKLLNLDITGTILEANAYAIKESIEDFLELQTTIYNLTNDLNNLDVVMANIDNYDYTSLFSGDSSGGGTESATTSLSAYFDQLNKISILKAKLSETEAKEEALGLDLTEDKVEIYKQLQNELHSYADSLRNERDILEKIVLIGDDEIARRERLAEINTSLIDLSAEYYGYTQKINEELDNTEDIIENHLNILQEQLDLQKEQEELLSTQKEAIEDLVDLEENRIKQALEDQIDDLEKQKDLQSDLVDLVKDKLEAEKETNDFNDSIADKQKEEAQLLSDINKLRLDPTQKGAVTKLEEELADIREEIAEEQADREYDVRVDTLDKNLDAYDDSKDKEIDILKSQLDKEEELRAQAMKNISDAINTEGSKIYEELALWNSEYGTSIESDITNAWDSAKEALSGYADVLSGLGGIDSGIANAQAIQKMIENSMAWFDASPDKRTRLENANMQTGTSMGWSRKSNGAWYDQVGDRVYDEGGVNDSTGLSMMHGTKSKSEVVFNSGQAKKLYDIVTSLPNMSNYQVGIPEYSRVDGSTTNSPVFSINVSGNADKSTIAKIQRAGDNMIQTFWKRGQGRPVQSLG